MVWKTIKEHMPRSAKVTPVWIKDNNTSDLVYLTDDEKYFVSIDHKRVYPVNNDIFWIMVEVPL